MSDNIAFYPINTCMGFAVGFDVVRVGPTGPGAPPEVELLVRFKEVQLPEGYNFAKLSEYFMQEKNIQRVELIGKNITNNRSRYDY